MKHFKKLLSIVLSVVLMTGTAYAWTGWDIEHTITDVTILGHNNQNARMVLGKYYAGTGETIDINIYISTKNTAGSLGLAYVRSTFQKPTGLTYVGYSTGTAVNTKLGSYGAGAGGTAAFSYTNNIHPLVQYDFDSGAPASAFGGADNHFMTLRYTVDPNLNVGDVIPLEFKTLSTESYMKKADGTAYTIEFVTGSITIQDYIPPVFDESATTATQNVNNIDVAWTGVVDGNASGASAIQYQVFRSTVASDLDGIVTVSNQSGDYALNTPKTYDGDYFYASDAAFKAAISGTRSNVRKMWNSQIGTGVTDTPPDGYTYYYAVRAYDTSVFKNRDKSIAVASTGAIYIRDRTNPTPSIPTLKTSTTGSVTASYDSGSVTLALSAYDNVALSGYTLYWKQGATVTPGTADGSNVITVGQALNNGTNANNMSITKNGDADTKVTGLNEYTDYAFMFVAEDREGEFTGPSNTSNSATYTIKTRDETAPVFTGGISTGSAISSTGITIAWADAFDSFRDSNVKYTVYQSTSPLTYAEMIEHNTGAINTEDVTANLHAGVSIADNGGGVSSAKNIAATGATITVTSGASDKYYFAVLACDGTSGANDTNCAAVVMDDADVSTDAVYTVNMPDGYTPTWEYIDGLISVGQVGANGGHFTWARAWDKCTGETSKGVLGDQAVCNTSENLEYQLYRSESAVNATDLFTGGNLIKTFTGFGITDNYITGDVFGFVKGVQYKVGMRVCDTATVHSVGTSKCDANTRIVDFGLLDNTGPMFTDYPTVSDTLTTSGSATLTWSAYDTSMSSANITYEIAVNTGSNIITKANYGTYLKSGAVTLTGGVTTAVVSGLSADTKYYFYVVASDLELHKTHVAADNVATTLSPEPAVGLPVFTSFTSSANTNTGFTVSWAATGTPAIDYYNIYVNSGATAGSTGGTTLIVTGVTVNSYIFSGADLFSGETTHYPIVVAVSASGSTVQSHVSPIPVVNDVIAPTSDFAVTLTADTTAFDVDIAGMGVTETGVSADDLNYILYYVSGSTVVDPNYASGTSVSGGFKAIPTVGTQKIRAENLKSGEIYSFFLRIADGRGNYTGAFIGSGVTTSSTGPIFAGTVNVNGVTKGLGVDPYSITTSGSTGSFAVYMDVENAGMSVDYTLYYGTGGNLLTSINYLTAASSVSTGGNSITLSNLPAGTYSLYLKATDNASGLWNGITLRSVTVGTPSIDFGENKGSVVLSASDRIAISWPVSVSQGVTTYEIYFSGAMIDSGSVAGMTPDKVVSATAVPVAVIGSGLMAANTTYYFVVKAVSANSSGYLATFSGSTAVAGGGLAGDVFGNDTIRNYNCTGNGLSTGCTVIELTRTICQTKYNATDASGLLPAVKANLLISYTNPGDTTQVCPWGNDKMLPNGVVEIADALRVYFKSQESTPGDIPMP